MYFCSRLVSLFSSDFRWFSSKNAVVRMHASSAGNASPVLGMRSHGKESGNGKILCRHLLLALDRLIVPVMDLRVSLRQSFLQSFCSWLKNSLVEIPGTR